MDKHRLRIVGGIFLYFASMVFLGTFIFVIGILNQSHVKVKGDEIMALIALPCTSIGCVCFGTKMVRKPRKLESENVAGVIHESGYPYAGLNRRAFAGLLDFLILLPFIIVGFVFQYKSKILYFISEIGIFLIVLGYRLIFNAIRGQTPGKMITRIKIFRTDGKTIGFKEAMLRLLMDCIFNLTLMAGPIISLGMISNRQFLIWGEKILPKYNPIPNWVKTLYLIWTLIDVIVFLINRQNRSAHDFIAGTVVLKMDRKKLSSTDEEAQSVM